MFDTDDWSDDYRRAEATIVSSREIQVGSDAPSQTTTVVIRDEGYSCGYDLEFVHDGERYTQRAAWLTEVYETERGEDCGAARYGETIPVWVQEGHEDSPPAVREVGDRSEKPMTIGFLFLMGIAFLYGSYRLGRPTWRRWKPAGTGE